MAELSSEELEKIVKEEDNSIKPMKEFESPEKLYQELIASVRKYHPSTDISLIEKAYNIAYEAHKGQVRKSGEPYIIHPLCVAIILAELELDKETIVAGLLHDVVEDTVMTDEEIRQEFGAEVALLVDGVTKLGQLSYDADKVEVQAENLRKMFLAMAKDIRVILIKLADRLHNMRTLKYMTPEKQKEKARETMDIYAPIAQRLGISKIKIELDDLSLKYLEPEAYYDLVHQIAQRKSVRDDYVQSLVEEVKKHIHEAGIPAQIDGRAKHFFSIYKKMKNQDKTLDQIYDLFAIRIIVDSVKDCYAALGVIHEMYKPIPGRFKDYIAMPKPNMYQSLHTTVLYGNGQPLEIQIRTFEMHRISEYGIAAHWRYKESGGSKPAPSAGGDKTFDAKLSWLRQLLEWHQDMSDSRDFVNTVKMDVFADEVFVFTPRGDVIDLPVGAVPIDFAYRIHTDVGNRCVGAKVNGRIVPLDYKLSNGDIVEVITSKQAAGPSRDWLNIVGSSDSRNKIKSWFKKERREENIIKGREMLEKECKRLGYDTKILLKSDKLKDVSAQLRLENEENLMATIGYGGITLNSVMSKLVELYKKEQKLTTTKDLSQLLAELKPRRSKAKSSHGILVKGEEGIMVKLARCCNPIPGDPVIGYITRGSGISVHRRDCPNVMSNNPEEQNRLIEVAWDIATDSLYKVNIIISAGDRPGMMADIMMVMSESKLNINALNCRIDKHKMANISMGIDISNLEQLDNIMNKIKRMKGVYSVERMISNGQGG